MNPKVWEASGHVGGFADPMVDCKAANREVWVVKLLRERSGREGRCYSRKSAQLIVTERKQQFKIQQSAMADKNAQGRHFS